MSNFFDGQSISNEDSQSMTYFLQFNKLKSLKVAQSKDDDGWMDAWLYVWWCVCDVLHDAVCDNVCDVMLWCFV